MSHYKLVMLFKSALSYSIRRHARAFSDWLIRRVNLGT
jgi:hypothetical protein